nr:unnamed protein product [Callosobruchus analis]
MSVAQELVISQSTVSKTISFVMNKIVEKSHVWIKFPSTQPKINEAQQAWQENFQFPSAIDCTHVNFLEPNQHGDDYVNIKGSTTINVQTTCNSVELFTSADVTWPVSVHDAGVWRNCDIRLTMRQFPGPVPLGGDGYGLEPWLMAPFKCPNNALERAYKRLFKKERVIIGQLKRRVPVLK